MHAEYGKQVGQAFAAVCQLHKDVSRLLTDMVPRMGTGRVNATAVIKGTSWQLNSSDVWMPYRVSMSSAGGDLPPNVSEFVAVYFWDDPPKPQEPHLVLARVTYLTDEDGKTWPDFWDADSACFEWDQPFPVGVVTRFSPPDHDRVESVALTAVPLFDITSVDDVLKLMETVRAVANTAGTSGTIAAPVRSDP